MNEEEKVFIGGEERTVWAVFVNDYLEHVCLTEWTASTLQEAYTGDDSEVTQGQDAEGFPYDIYHGNGKSVYYRRLKVL